MYLLDMIHKLTGTNKIQILLFQSVLSRLVKSILEQIYDPSPS